MSFNVISNSSRYWRSFKEAVSQPTAKLELAIFQSQSSLAITNVLYDQSLIAFDDNYCTDNPIHHYESLRNIETLINEMLNVSDFFLVDIGCGQGELVKYFQSRGIDAWGFDPCLREESNKLIKSFFTPQFGLQELKLKPKTIPIFTMRCVLPHIKHYNEFLQELFNCFPNALVYLEYQSLERLLRDHSWYMFNHDHCNYFTHESFNSYNIDLAGSFKEWDYVVLSIRSHQYLKLDVKDKETVKPSTPKMVDKCNSVMRSSQFAIDSIAGIAANRRLCIYSAAGKGANFGFAASQSSAFTEIYAVDLSNHKWNLFLEGSGIKVHNPQELEDCSYKEDLVVVLNRSHLERVKALGFKNILSHHELFDDK